MEREQALAQIDALIRGGQFQELMTGRFALRHHDRARYLSAALTASASGTAIDWSTSRADAPATADAIVAWITPERTPRQVQTVAWTLSLDDPNPMSRKDFALAVAQRAPTRSAFASENLGASARGEAAFAELEPAVAAAMRDALLAGAPWSSAFDAMTPAGRVEVMRAWARSSVELPEHRLRDFRDAASAAPAEYGALVARAALKVRKNDVDRLWIELGALDADAVEAVLRALRAKDAHFARLAFHAARAGTAACAEGLARLLPDAARGRACARWLSLMGAVGRESLEAARARASGKAKADQRVRALCDEALAIPGAPFVLRALDNEPSGWSLDATRFAIDPLPAPAEGTAPHAPTPLDALCRAVDASTPQRADLSPEGWADLLQVATLDLWIDDRDAAFSLAESLGLLGWGADPGRVLAALDRCDLDRALRPGGQGLGLGHVLLGMNASRELWLHALARYASRRRQSYLGSVERHFITPLTTWGGPDAAALAALARHIELTRSHGIRADELARYPTLESCADAGTSWRSAATHADLRARVTVTGATKVTLRARGAITFEVDVARRRWSQQGLEGPAEGGTTLFGHERAVQLDVELVDRAARLAANGTHLLDGPKGHLYERAPLGAGHLEVETDGRIARVTLTAMRGMRLAQRVTSVAGFDELKSLKDLAEGTDDVTAQALAVAARFSPDEALRAAAEKALSEAGDFAAPWREALGLRAVEAVERRFEVEPFAVSAKRFETLKAPKKVKVAEGVQGFARALAVGNPAQPKWGRGAVSEDSVYLVEGDGWRGEGVRSAKGLLDTSMPAITTWNSRGTGRWAGEPGQWMLVVCDDLQQEQDDWETMSFAFGAWRVAEGVALAAWKGQRDELATLMGLPDGLPPRSAWTDIKVWIGE
ncbi:MAG: hypothetical protein R3A48_00980 [Polyangiales bacterium]